jgi:hypothetical protein
VLAWCLIGHRSFVFQPSHRDITGTEEAVWNKEMEASWEKTDLPSQAAKDLGYLQMSQSVRKHRN